MTAERSVSTFSCSHAAYDCGVHILRGARAQSRRSYLSVDVLCLIVPFGAPWVFIIFYFPVCVFDIFCSLKCSAPHLAFFSERLVALRGFAAGRALEFEEDLRRYAYDLFVFV